MEREELNIEELSKVNVTQNQEVNYEKAMQNKNLYRSSSIEELRRIKEEILKEREQSRKSR